MKISGIITLILCLISFKSFSGDNDKLIQNYLNQLAKKSELHSSDVADWIITDSHIDKRNNIEFVYIAQKVNGIKIQNGLANFSIKNGAIKHFGNRLIADIESKANSSEPSFDAKNAIQIAAQKLGIDAPTNLEFQEKVTETKSTFNKAGISLEPITTELVYLEHEGQIKLSWNVSIYELNAHNWWSVNIDAENGQLLEKDNWVDHCEIGSFNDRSDHGKQVYNYGSVLNSSMTGPEYTVFALPAESPNHGPYVLIQDPSDSLSSPFGWHDTNGFPGAEYTITRGNNVYAYEDSAGASTSLNNFVTGYSPNSPSLHFNYPVNASSTQPHLYKDAAITNLFYMNNMMHDIWYHYGFDEASGNFQTNNYGNGGVGNDHVMAEAMDGGGTNNANFATPFDGSRPRMQMYLWSGGSDMTVNSPTVIAGSYNAVQAGFGPGINVPLTGDLVLVDDGSLPNPADACEPIINGSSINGKIAVIDRGDCTFVNKILNAQSAGAIAVIMVNNVGGGAITMGGSSAGINIPSVMISLSDGNIIKNQMTSGTVNVTLNPSTQLDGDFDNGIVAHEYGHGISNRLAGGPSASCLGNAEQMGEGWSDWFGLMLTIDSGDQGSDIRGIGTFAINQSTTGNGIRPAPYSTDFNVNPFTYGASNSPSISQPHGLGFVFATALWDLTWALINQYGGTPDPDLYSGTGGNNIAMHLVITGLKLQPCFPGMIDGRDAILAADQLLYNGAHQCLIWNVFANRGFGFSASQGSSSSRFDQVEAFDLPPFCQTASVAPNANFTFSPQMPSCENAVLFSDSSINVPQNWAWDFGDGTVDSTFNPSHAYTSPGTYNVKMVVWNTVGVDSITKTVTIGKPITPSVQDKSVCSGLNAVLIATSNVGTTEWYDAQNNLVSTGPVFIASNVTTNRTYYIRNRLGGSNSQCYSDFDTAEVIAVISDFSHNQVGATVNFTDLSNGASTWDWDFGDGNTSKLQNPSHNYASAGNYDVTLTVNNGQCSSVQTISVVSGLNSDIAGGFVNLFPNPAKDRLTISLKEKSSEDLHISINDLQGKLISSQILKAGNESLEIEISKFESAVYTVKIHGAEINETKMLIIE